MDETINHLHDRIDELHEQRSEATSSQRKVIDEELLRLHETLQQLVGIVPVPPEYR